MPLRSTQSMKTVQVIPSLGGAMAVQALACGYVLGS